MRRWERKREKSSRGEESPEESTKEKREHKIGKEQKRK